jgi:multimeric flavodoxin WrbA
VKNEYNPSSENKIRRHILLINGSPHTDGPTARLLDTLVKALPAAAVIDRFDCFERNPLPCNDCRACHRVDSCSLRDLDDYYSLLENADGLVFATPVYNLSFPAPLKALIDRSQRYWAARFVREIRPPIPRPKTVALLTASGDDNAQGGLMLERQLRPVLTILNGKLTQTVHYAGADSGKPIEPYLQEAEKAGRTFL